MPALPPPPTRDPLHRILHKLSRVASTSSLPDLSRSPSTTSSSSSSAKSMSNSSSPSGKKAYVVDMEGPLCVLEGSSWTPGAAQSAPADKPRWTKRYCQLVGATLYIYDAGQSDDLWVDKVELSVPPTSTEAKLLCSTSSTSFTLPRHLFSRPGRKILSFGHGSIALSERLHFKAATVTEAKAWIDAFAAIITPSLAKKRRVQDTPPQASASTAPTQPTCSTEHSNRASPTTSNQSQPNLLADDTVAVADQVATTYVVTLPSLPPAKVLHIVLVRHGHYVNAHSKHALDSDQVLSHIGRRQADCAGRHLRHQLVTGSSSRHDPVLLHSDMERAVETAAIISGYFPDSCLTPTPLLREGWPGAPSKTTLAVHAASDEVGEEARVASTAPSPEAQAAEDRRLDMAFQATFALEDTDQDNDRGRASLDPEEVHHGAAAAFGTTNCRVVVCHANLIRYFLCRAMGVSAAGVWGAFEINHCGITRIDVSSTGACKILAVNECGHLPQTLLTSSTDHL
ncbi:hypothetical protein H310_05126 [Aphanomyces invadans]|uniref:Serine/threonine-protein phosphatase PGAM5, mitochondrial n=1 Tax=Aphanomyces invadans TaxID=157072 RepID=A0A024UCZ6_9STRA|nr:hypothetical protein H310_05126 [Aphanomyces invadans]ETW03757.1 hypothetical protein H310_05126 [Aphanomyces invadans]|eukprot:XP_008867986.1 hypothetical protein H310_05126 [Aphanomyces invadans]